MESGWVRDIPREFHFSSSADVFMDEIFNPIMSFAVIILTFIVILIRV